MDYSLRAEMAMSGLQLSQPSSYMSFPVTNCDERVSFTAHASNCSSIQFQSHTMIKISKKRFTFLTHDLFHCERSQTFPLRKQTHGNRRASYFRTTASGSTSKSSEHSNAYVLSMEIPSQRDSNHSILKLENLIQEAVFDVVRNIQEAPFFHLIFEKSSGRKNFASKKFSKKIIHNPESWVSIKDSILEGSPDGIILVRSLDQEEVSQTYGLDQTESLDQSCEGCPLIDDCTSFWGVVVQSSNCKRHVCYILKTTKVQSAGISCTSFSLTRAKNFGTSVYNQLEKAWLL